VEFQDPVLVLQVKTLTHRLPAAAVVGATHLPAAQVLPAAQSPHSNIALQPLSADPHSYPNSLHVVGVQATLAEQSAAQLSVFSLVLHVPSPHIEAIAQVPLWQVQIELPMPQHLTAAFAESLCVVHQDLLKHLWQVPLSPMQSLSALQFV
jgi:hypothetical protein